MQFPVHIRKVTDDPSHPFPWKWSWAWSPSEDETVQQEGLAASSAEAEAEAREKFITMIRDKRTQEETGYSILMKVGDEEV